MVVILSALGLLPVVVILSFIPDEGVQSELLSLPIGESGLRSGQFSHTLAPVEYPYLPAGQSEQEDLPTVAEYLPARHAEQVWSDAANLPVCQEKQHPDNEFQKM